MRGLTTPAVAGIIIVLGLAATGFWAIRGDTPESSGRVPVDIFIVKSGSFEISIPASGELAAQKQIEIKNKLESRAVITEIVDEGELIKKDDVVVRFNDEDIRTRVKDAEEAVIFLVFQTLYDFYPNSLCRALQSLIT